jgi:hypothetical protein
MPLVFSCCACDRHPALAAENLFLRKQLAQYQERQVKPRRANNATRMVLIWLSRFFDWRRVLVIVKPVTLIRWHRQGFRLFWRWKSTPGRPPLPRDLQAIICPMALENPTWGQERITNGLLLKLGLRVSPRTVRQYMPGHCVGGQANAVNLNAGPHLFVIMLKALSRVTSAWQSRRHSAFSMSL